MAQIIITAGIFIFLLQLKQDQVQQLMNDGRGLDGELSSPFDLVDERGLTILADAQDGSGEPRPVSLEVFHLLAVSSPGAFERLTSLRAGQIRTGDLVVPNHALYQAKLQPVSFRLTTIPKAGALPS
jgi:hypothetical protein